MDLFGISRAIRVVSYVPESSQLYLEFYHRYRGHFSDNTDKFFADMQWDSDSLLSHGELAMLLTYLS